MKILAALVIVSLACAPAVADTPERPDCENEDAFTILAFAGLVSAITWTIDEKDKIANVLMQSPYEDVFGFGNKWGSGWVIGGGSASVFAIGALGGGQRMKTLGADMVRSYALSGAFTLALKKGVSRTRPNGGAYSFPSGHTSSAFSIVPALHHHLGWRASVPAATLGVITALGRMQDRYHYLSDVIFGAALGWVAGDYVIRRLRSGSGSGNVMLAPGLVGYTASF